MLPDGIVKFPYVGIIQIRLWVKANSLLSAGLFQLPLMIKMALVNLFYQRYNYCDFY